MQASVSGQAHFLEIKWEMCWALSQYAPWNASGNMDFLKFLHFSYIYIRLSSIHFTTWNVSFKWCIHCLQICNDTVFRLIFTAFFNHQLYLNAKTMCINAVSKVYMDCKLCTLLESRNSQRLSKAREKNELKDPIGNAIICGHRFIMTY